MVHVKSELPQLSYVLITPARNEEAFIEKTMQAVASQTVLPRRWVIVSDGSTDRTDSIIKFNAHMKPWIEFVRLPEHASGNFAAKVNAFYAGFDRLKNTEYDIIGSLDADITFDKDYFEFLLPQFSVKPDLGVAGTPFVEKNGQTYDFSFTNVEHVSGACQLFRKACFKDIGGYVPIKAGGIDWVAVTTARMKGWKTKTFTEKVCYHHRKIGTGTAKPWKTGFKHGRKDYCLGGHPLWQVFRCAYQMTRKPYGIGGFSLLAGYAWAMVSRAERPISKELMLFHRAEQLRRLRNRVLKITGMNPDNASPRHLQR
jgi:glycosyltransferase involved in cell wall biosynthesis